MMKRAFIRSMATLLIACVGCSPNPKEEASAVLPINPRPPVVVESYDLFDCGASQLVIKDKTGQHLFLFNKPFLPEFFLSARRFSSEPDMTCSIQITAELPLRQTLIACLGEFLESRCNAKTLERIGNTKDFLSLSESEKILSGTLMILNSLQEIKKSDNQRAESTVLPKRQN